MEIYKTKVFAREAKKLGLPDSDLRKAVEAAEKGLIDADLGGGIIKLRVARRGQGKSGGFRTVLAYTAGSRAVFIYPFAKNDRANVTSAELETMREIGQAFLRA